MVLQYFQPSEFQGWWDLMDPRLMVDLDSLRHQWARPIYVSPADGAVGRRSGQLSRSRHNIEYWIDGVQAIDLMPAGIESAEGLLHFLKLATKWGFHGQGIYHHWRPSPGVHLDIRDEPAQWGAVREGSRQRYVPFEEALSHWPR